MGFTHPRRFAVMSFNIKYAVERGPNRWSLRRPILANVITGAAPHLIGTQEGMFRQLREISVDLPSYEWIGLGRDGGSEDEFCAIFFRRDRFQPMAFRHLWLSESPRLAGSISWGAGYPRMVTWVRFRETCTGVEFYHWNTHFDNESQQARRNSAKLLLNSIREVDPPLPVIVTGDFNDVEGSPTHQRLLARDEGQLFLVDTWRRARVREGERLSTWHNWQGPNDEARRLDWILTSPHYACQRTAILSYQESGLYPSDHFPLICDLELTS